MNRRNFIRAGVVALALTTGLARARIVVADEPTHLVTFDSQGGEDWARLMTPAQVEAFLSVCPIGPGVLTIRRLP